MIGQVSEGRPEVIHRSFDVYEFYLRRLGMDENTLLQLWSYDEVKRVVALYIHFGLPLDVATVYVAYEWTKKSAAGTLSDSRFTPVKLMPLYRLHGIGCNATAHFIIGKGELEVVRQLARLVEYRLDGQIPGFGTGEKISLALVSYPRPLLSSTTFSDVRRWLESENVEVLASSQYDSDYWMSSKNNDYAEYIQHWIKANWVEFNEMFHDPIITELLDEEKASQFEPWDWLIEIEQKWTRNTHYLTPRLRIQLLVTISSSLCLGLTTVTPGAGKTT